MLPLAPPNTLAEPMTSPFSNSARLSKARNPQVRSLRASSARSRPVFRPLTTTTRRTPFSTAEPMRPNPESSMLPVFRPSAPMFIVSKGLRLTWRILFHVNSVSPKYL